MRSPDPPRELAEERAIGISIEGRPFAVLMATPDDLIDLAFGFAITEAITTPAEIARVEIGQTAHGLSLNVWREVGAPRITPRARTLESRSGCGLCGTRHLSQAIRPLPAVPQGTALPEAAVMRALAELEDRQWLGQRTRATHAAGFADASGAMRLLREDVGRHNALDKLAGAMARGGVDAGGGFVVVTSRCSFEMVEKTARIGAPVLVAVSAPTTLAIERAETCGLTLIALARADGFRIFTGPHRIARAASGQAAHALEQAL